MGLRALAVLISSVFFLGAWGAGFIYPLSSLLFPSYFLERSALDGSAALAELLSAPVLRVVRATLVQAAASTGLALAVGFPLGVWVGLRAPGRKRWLALPYSIPTLVIAVAALRWLGSLKYTLGAVILAHAWINAPWIALWVALGVEQTPRGEIEAARSLGAGRGLGIHALWLGVRTTLLPRAIPWAASAAMQVLILCANSFTIVLLLGGGPPVETLETALYARVRVTELDLEGAWACAFWQLAFTATPWLLWTLFGPNKNASTRPPIQQTRGRLLSLAAVTVWLVPFLALLDPGSIAAVLRANGPEIWQATQTSFQIALLCTSFALFSAISATLTIAALAKSWPNLKKLLLALALAPSGLSPIVLGLGFWFAYASWVDPFDGSLALVAALQGMLFAPLVVRALHPLAENPDTRLLNAAATLGASPWLRIRAVEWPRWRAPLFAAAAIVFASSLGELAAVSFFASESVQPLPLLISRWTGQYRFSEAEAVAGLLLVVGITATLGIQRLGEGPKPIC